MHLVSLGSSFAAGPSIPPQTSAAARRSGANYPSLLATALKANLTDLSSSGATLLNVLSDPQQTLLATLPPQLSALPADADIVTLTAGGNDLGYSAGMIADAARVAINDKTMLGVVMESMGLKMDGQGGVGGAVGVEEVTQRFIRVIDAVRAKAPQAKIFLVEYLAVFGEASTFSPSQPLDAGKVALYREMERGLRRAYADAAVARVEEGVEVVRVGEMSEGHCVGSQEPWVVGFTEDMLMRGGAPFHPNAAGHVAVAREVEGSVRSAFGEEGWSYRLAGQRS